MLDYVKIDGKALFYETQFIVYPLFNILAYFFQMCLQALVGT